MSGKHINVKALKYNVTKKISQLQRVIYEFSSTISEMEYQKEYLINRYMESTRMIIEAYSGKANVIEKELKEQTEELSDKIDKLYQKNLEQQKEDLNIAIDASTKNIAEFVDKITQDFEQIITECTMLVSGSDDFTGSFNENADSYIKQLNKSVEQAKKKIASEIKSLDDETEKRIAALIQSQKDNLERLHADHQKEVDSIRGKKKDSGSMKDVIDKITATKNNIGRLKASIESAKNNIEDLKKASASYFAKAREELKSNTSNLAELIQKNAEEINSKNTVISEYIKTQQSLLENKEKDLTEAEDKHREEISMLRDNAKNESEKMKIEFSNKSKQIRDQFDNSDASLAGLAESQKAELERIKQSNEEYKIKAEVKRSQTQKGYDAAIQDNISKKAQLLEEIDNLKIEFENASKERQSKFDSDQLENEKKFDESKSALEARLNSLTSFQSDGQAKLTEELQNVQRQLIETQNRDKKEQEEFDAETDRILEDLRGKDQSSEKQKSHSEELESVKVKYSQEIETLKETCQKEYDELQKSLQSHHEESMDLLRKNGLGKEELEEFMAKYRSQFDEENKKLISLASVQQSEDFSGLDAAISALQKQKEELDGIVRMQEETLRGEWDSKIQQENERHTAALRENSLGDKRSEERFGFQQELENLKNARMAAEADLNKQISDEIEKHAKEYAENETILKEFTDIDDSGFKAEIESLREKLGLVAMAVESAVSAEKDKGKNERKAAKLEHISQMEQMKGDLAESMKSHHQIKASLENDLKEAEERSAKEIENAKALIEGKKTFENNNHKTQMENIKKSIEDAKRQLDENEHNIDIKLNKQKASLQSSCDEFVRKTREEIDKKLKEWEAMCAFYDESIDVARNKRDDYMERYKTMPPRQQEADMIERMEGELQRVTFQLKSALKDTKEYRGLMQTQEHKYNERFGGSPKVGELTHKNIRAKSKAEKVLPLFPN